MPVFILSHLTARKRAAQAIAEAPDGTVVKVEPAKRSLEQNARMWALLTEVSRQVDWHGQKLAPDDWKAIFTSALKRHRMVPGIDGGFVVLGTSTSQMTKADMGDLMTLIEAFGAEHGVDFETATAE